MYGLVFHHSRKGDNMELKKRNSMLNLTAEEASELAEVCIRMKESKKYIDEKIREKITKQLTEEIADVENCVYVLCEEKILDRRRVEEFTTEKYKRSYEHNICLILTDLSMSCNRLTKAALKVNRVEDIYNPTPLSYASTIWTLYEEITDVMVLINHIYNENFISEKDVDDIKIFKMKRWKERLERIEKGEM